MLENLVSSGFRCGCRRGGSLFPSLFLIASLLSACSDLPARQPANLLVIGAKALTSAKTVDGGRDAWPAAEWWRELADPQLDGLMTRALQQNPSLALAQARLAQAQAAAGVTQAATAVQVNADVSLTRGRQSENYMIPKPPLGVGGEVVSIGQAGINFGFELDLWGRQAALIRAAQDQIAAAQFEREAARLALTINIARLYGQLAHQYERQELAQALLQRRQMLNELLRQRVAAGLETQIEHRQAETGIAALQLELLQLQTAMRITCVQLLALSGQVPSMEQDPQTAFQKPQLQTPSWNVPLNLPLDLLARRPELAAQRMRLAAADEWLTAAATEFYPNLNLSALLGYQAIGLNRLFEAGSASNHFGPALHLPIYGGGRLKANYAAREAEYTQAVAQYNQTLLNAVQDSVEQLTRAAAYAREESTVNAGFQAASEAYRMARLRHREGLMSKIGLLNLELQMLIQQGALADLKARRFDLQMTLVRALGGGFVTPTQALQVMEKP